MYNDVKKKTNWKIATEDDVKEIKDILEYVEGLVIKNQQEADRGETMSSIRKSTIYISAVLELNDTSELDRRIIIESYEEENDYYKNLYENFGISYVDGRTAKNFRILKVLKPTLNKEDEMLFNQCYNETLEYFSKVIYTKAFSNQKYNFEYFRLLITNFAVQKYLTRKLGYFFNIDLYERKRLKNAFISYGFDYFDILPLNYQRRLLKLINELVQSKGTNSDIQKLLNIFGFRNMNIYKYILSKGYKQDGQGGLNYDEPYLVFYKTKANDIIDFEKDIMLNYDSVVEGDPFWRCDKEDILNNKKFNNITSKYMSVDLSLDIVKETMRMSYFTSFLYKMEKEYKEKQDIDFGFVNRNISQKKISLFDAVVGLQSLILKSLKLKDKINNNPDQSLFIYGYDYIENNDDIKNLLIEIQDLLIQNEHRLNYKRQFKELYKFFNNFNLKNFSEPLDFKDFNVIYNLYEENSLINRQLLSLHKYTEDEAVKLFMEADNTIIDKLEFIRTYLIRGDYKCEDVYNLVELQLLLSKYIVIQGFREPSTRIQVNEIFNNNQLIIKEMKEFVYNINDSSLIGYFIDGDYFKVIDFLFKFITDRREEIKKKYEFKDDDSFKAAMMCDPLDLLYYKELNAFCNIFVLPFKDLNFEKKYTVDHFVDIFLGNEELRTELQRFIVEVDEYHLYKKFNDLFDIKMKTKFISGLFDGFETYSEYIAYKDIDFYDWMTPKENVEIDKKARKDFYTNRIFELCESIDNYIGGLDLFMNHTFTGIIDFIRKILYLVITVFKSYTIDLLDTNTVLYVDDKGFNAIRTFDEIESMTVNDQLSEKVSIIDVYRTWVNEEVSDKIGLREAIRIKEAE